MIRRALALALPVAVASACSPIFDQEIGWTIDGEDPATACKSLPKGASVEFVIASRDNADERFGGAVTETKTSAACGGGTATIQTGPFADVLTRVVADDVVIGVAAPVAVSPGAPASGYAIESEPVVADIRVTQGTLRAELTVVGQSCGDAGATSFQVSLFETSEPRTNVPVKTGVAVACEDGVAIFSYAPVTVGATYVVQATTTIGGVAYATAPAGEGVDVAGAATTFVADLAVSGD